jgi:hypothetical protein
VTGTGFIAGIKGVPGSKVTTNIAGATVAPPTGVTSTSFHVTITVPSGTAASSTYTLTVTNPDGGRVTYGNLSVS